MGAPGGVRGIVCRPVPVPSRGGGAHGWCDVGPAVESVQEAPEGIRHYLMMRDLLRMHLVSMGIGWALIAVGSIRLLGLDKGLDLVMLIAGVWGVTTGIVSFLRVVGRSNPNSRML